MSTRAPHFDGPEYQPELDFVRLSGQIQAIRDFMLAQSAWLTLPEICAGLRTQHPGSGFPENSVQAQLRHLRKPRFGGYEVGKRRRGDGGRGLFEWRVFPHLGVAA